MLNNDALDILRKTLDTLIEFEAKERRVRTPAGQDRFGQPIGAIIIADGIGGGVSDAPKTPSVDTPARSSTDTAKSPEGGPYARVDQPLKPWYSPDPKVTHPNVNEYTTSPSMGGLKPDGSIVGFVRTDAIVGMEGNVVNPERVEEIKGEIDQFGIKEPINIIFNPKSGLMYVGDGNHRVQAAQELGMPWVPVRVSVSRSKWSEDDIEYIKGKGSVLRDSGKTWEDTPWTGNVGEAYWPTEMHPSFLFGDKDVYSEDKVEEVPAPEPTAEEDGQYVFPGMPEPVKQTYTYIGITGTETDANIDLAEFDAVVRPYKPIPTSVQPVIRREQREKDASAIQELDPEAMDYESDTQENGGLLTNVLSAYSGSWISPEKDNAKVIVKISVNDQITRRVMDHAEANLDFKGWLDNYQYRDGFTSAMRGAYGNLIRYNLPELQEYAEEIDFDEYRSTVQANPEGVSWILPRPTNEPERYMRIKFDSVPADVREKVVKISMLAAVLEGTANPDFDEPTAINPRDISYIAKAAEDFEYREVAARFITRKIIDKWAGTSGDHDKEAVLLQQIVMEKFGLEDVSADSHLGTYDADSYKQLGPFYEVFVDAMYQNTQGFFRENGIKYVNAYRGMKWEPDDIPNWARDGFIDIEEVISERINEASQYYADESVNDNEAQINEETQDRLDSDFNQYWAGREEEFWADADFDLEEASEREKDDYRDEKRQEYYEQYWEEARDRAEQSWRDNAEQSFFDNGMDQELRDEVMSELIDEMRPTGTIKVESQPLSSWSTSESTAEGFSSEGGFYGLVVSGRIPVERIFCTTLTGLGCLSESELVVLGDYDELTVQ